MDPQIPTSFIPKRPVVSGVVAEPQSSRAVGLLSLITAIVAIATVVSFAFVFLYQRTLTSQKTKLEQSINDARNGVGTDFLADMQRLNARIMGVNVLLKRHIVVSPIFDALQATTLRSVQYKTFTYQFTTDPATKTQLVQVQLTGTARNYGTIALQSDAFAQNSLIRNPVFSDLTVDDKTSAIGFKLMFDVAPEDLSFETFIKNHNLGTAAQQSASAAPATGSTVPAVSDTTTPAANPSTTNSTNNAAATTTP